MSAQEIDEQIRREAVSECYTAYTRQGGNVYPESETEQALRAEIAALKARLAKLVDRWSHMVPMNKYSDEQVAYYDSLHDCADELDAVLKVAK